MTRKAAALALVPIVFALARVQAGDPAPRGPGFLVCYPHGPGTTESGRPVMERLGAALSAATGDEVKPTFFSEVEPALAYLERERPRSGILSLPLYLAWREGQCRLQSDHGLATIEGDVPVVELMP